MLEVELPTPATMDLDWLDHPLVPASLKEAGLDHNQFVIVRLPYSIYCCYTMHKQLYVNYLATINIINFHMQIQSSVHLLRVQAMVPFL